MTNVLDEVCNQFLMWEDQTEPRVRWLGFTCQLRPNEDNTRVVVEGSDLEFADVDDFEKWFDLQVELNLGATETFGGGFERIPNRSAQVVSCTNVESYTKTTDGLIPSVAVLVRVPYRVTEDSESDDGRVIPGPWKKTDC